jgi:hypothetical protein
MQWRIYRNRTRCRPSIEYPPTLHEQNHDPTHITYVHTYICTLKLAGVTLIDAWISREINYTVTMVLITTISRSCTIGHRSAAVPFYSCNYVH